MKTINPTTIIVRKETTGIAFPLFLVFLVLKLCGVISWSWWWVTCPLWIPFAIWAALIGMFFGFAVLALLVGCVVTLCSKRK